MKPLTVYKASAGSGKTFTLATEYIKLVVNNPNCYRNILAVTFTNKATEEMKVRILSQLYGIWKQLPDSQAYLEKVKEGTQLSDKQIAQQAGIALRNLIHNYNYFRVETIDKFFQSVLRNLARELDLTANLRVGLNDKQVEQQAVDELIENLDVKNEMLSWILDYIHENIEDDKSWNVIGQIKKFGENIFKDYYKETSKVLNEKLEEKDFFKTFTTKMHKIRQAAKEQLTHLPDPFFTAIEENNLSETDFKSGKRGVYGYFIKLQNGKFNDEDLLTKTILSALEDPFTWVKKSDAVAGNPIFDLINDRLFNILHSCEEIRPKQLKIYKSADLTVRHLNQLRLLSNIERQVRKMNEDANRFLLSDTQTLLGSLIQDSDSPFIFEKIGTQLDHIMIDEFQDTSTIQWKNFKVLLTETMSRSANTEIPSTVGHTVNVVNNMLVGDVKQSIYRWRSGDWRLLNEINKEFSNAQLQIENLETNHRSNRNIITFNNVFFKEAANMEYLSQKEENPEEAEQLKNAYLDVEQKIPEDKPEEGEVKIELLPLEDYQNEMLQLTTNTVKELISNGIQEKNIAILVRNHKNIQDIADYFMQNEPDIKLVSNEAFRLDASVAVNILVNALHLLTHQDDQLAKAYLVKTYQKNVINNNITESQLFNHQHTLEEYLPDAFSQHQEELLALPLFDLVEEIYRIFQLDQLNGENAYICSFFDKLGNYLLDNTSDIDSFIEEWEENIKDKTIQSDEVNGVRLITIHQSKGLEFDNVIIPFCDWKLEQTNTVWCKPQVAPFNELPLVPVDFYAKQMKGSIYEQDYKHEHLQNIVDNLNLLYVAFTRAGKNLYIYGKRTTASSRSYIIEQCIGNVANKLHAHLDGITTDMTTKADQTENLSFEFGELSLPSPPIKQKVSTQNVFLAQVRPHLLDIHSYKSKVEFRQSNKSRDFISLPNDEDIEKNQQQDYISMGTLLHNLFATIHTTEDIEPAIRQFELDGVLFDEHITQEKLQSILRERLDTPQVREWFSQRWKLFNECTILNINPETQEVEEHRPDRVMTDGKEMIVVDFKFGHPRNEYHDQVHQYMNLLQQMGYTNIKGYLWFVYSNKIEEVK